MERELHPSDEALVVYNQEQSTSSTRELLKAEQVDPLYKHLLSCEGCRVRAQMIRQKLRGILES